MDFQKLLKIIAAVIGVISITFLITIISTGDDAIKAGEVLKALAHTCMLPILFWESL